MSYKALYRTYRPSSFEDVVGQKHIVATLQNAVKQNKIAHAYLFCGPRGTGKTSVAKLLAKAVNCEDSEHAPCGKCRNCLSIQQGNHPDIVEIDAASNNGVDEIRDLIEKVKYSPIEGKYKVYIIDEVHMLSTGAFNALLKTLEEPPSHVLFVLATTEPHKVLPTIISRCQRYDFTKVDNEEMIRRIHQILQQEKIDCEEEAIRLIVTLADGGLRDALSILDQCIAYAGNQITAKHVNEIYGITTVAEKLQMIHSIFEQDACSVLNHIKTWNEKGIDIRRLTADLIEILKEAVIYGYTKDDSLLVKLKETEAQSILQQESPKLLLEMIQVLMETTEKYRNASNVSSYFEVAVLKMISVVSEKTKACSLLEETIEKTDWTSEPSLEEHEEIENQEVQEAPKEQENTLNKQEAEESIPALIVEEPEAELIVQEVSTKKNTMPLGINVEDILGLMVQASKAEKNKDLEQWKLIEGKCRDLECARYANLLKGSTVAASGEDFLLIATDYPALANEIAELKEETEQFIREHLNVDKTLFITTLADFKEAAEAFIQRRKMGTLPNPLPIEKKARQKTEIPKDKTMTAMISLFGDDFELIEEEEK